MLNRAPNEPNAADREKRATELIGRASELIPLFDRASDRIERERRVPDNVLDALHDARLFRLLLPRSCDRHVNFEQGHRPRCSVFMENYEFAMDKLAVNVWRSPKLVLQTQAPD